MTPEELTQMRDQTRQKKSDCKHCVNVCTAAGCLSLRSDQLKDAIDKAVHHAGRQDEVTVKSVGCMGLCSGGPLVSVESGDDEVMYHDVKPEDAGELVQSLDTEPVKRLQCPSDMPFFTQQTKIVLENSGKIDPELLEDYIANDGYAALTKALTEMSPEDVIKEVQTSGLRGRGGGGYPTGLKWSTVAKSPGQKKYVICNADEGDPGAFMDRSVLESDPHRVLEGMALAAYAVGADAGYIYVRAEYPLAIARLKRAIRQAERAGLLGAHIGGSTFRFMIELRLGAGAFVCGEETALIASVEGKRGQPRPRPPYPAQRGLWGCPTLINNVETFANIAPIVRNGGDWFASIGTEKAKGTKVFALAGKINNTGLIEVPMGISLREIVENIGGGVPDGKQFKAVQTGGPSGGCIPIDHLDMPVEYDTLKQLGSIMGSGGMIIMDETSNMVDVARYFMEFCMSESCGKCVPCRVGTWQMHELLTKIIAGEAAPKDLDLLKELCEVVQNTSLCGLGMTSPNPVLSTLRYFEHEYLERLNTNGHGATAEAASTEGA
ncbi:NADH-quinone oxidoreductase subunit NuoF [Planctomycetales bacterium ZRK34]|nr:NADH-quinone oxidoreductase subunit NuoF [Planctomycetales bacterium ZRK34]